VPAEEYWACWSSLKGFSFSCKKWGEIAIEHVTEIEFDHTA